MFSKISWVRSVFLVVLPSGFVLDIFGFKSASAPAWGRDHPRGSESDNPIQGSVTVYSGLAGFFSIFLRSAQMRGDRILWVKDEFRRRHARAYEGSDPTSDLRPQSHRRSTMHPSPGRPQTTLLARDQWSRAGHEHSREPR